MQTRTSSHKEDNIAWHLIYHRWIRRLQPHALFVLSKFLYIFRVKVTHCQLAVCPAHLLLYICHTLHLNLISLTSSLCALETKEENRKNGSNRSSLIIISKIVRGFIHACLSLKANEGGLDCGSSSQKGIKTIRAKKQNKTKISLWKKDFRKVCFHQGFARSVSAKEKCCICIVPLLPTKNKQTKKHKSCT